MAHERPMITISCPECGTTSKVPNSAAGELVHCDRCNIDFTVPRHPIYRLKRQPTWAESCGGCLVLIALIVAGLVIAGVFR